jgi:alkanesulfonate monooxygenase SsuD/methylene tetrahydromethanopterin reductase-like flavin-dependent oxidoreductase (luciferase family)
LKLGLALGGAARPEDWPRIFAWAARAEALGLHSLWLPEGHFRRGALASPLLVLSAIAARTRRLRLATSSLLLPVQHPLRVAQEVAVLDLLSGGRVILGVGRGFAAPLFHAFGLDVREKRDRFDEALDAILRAWAGEPLTLAGEHFATLDGHSVVPSLRPLQRPHPPLVVAAFGRKGLLQAARRGLPWLASPLESLEVLAENLAFHRAHLPPGVDAARLGMPLLRTVHVAATDSEARRVREALEAESARTLAGLPAALARSAAGPLAARALVGTANEVRALLARYRERLGMDLLVARIELPGSGEAERRASLERLVELVAEQAEPPAATTRSAPRRPASA